MRTNYHDSKWTRWAGHVARVGAMTNAYKTFHEEPNMKTDLMEKG
jgi:hypothetical protein